STNRFSLDKVLTIPPGRGGSQIAALLESEGIVNDARLFGLLLRVTGTDRRLQAGDYLLNPTMSPLTILDTLNAGRVVVHEIVIPEGYSLEQIGDVLGRAGLVSKERFIRLAS